MQRRLSKSSWLVLVSLAAALVLAAAISGGVLDRFAADDGIDKTVVVGTLAVYWVVFFAIVWLLPRAIRHPKEAIVCLTSTVAALLLVEIAARIFVPSARAVRVRLLRSRQFHHVYAAGARMYMGRFDGKDVFVETNEDGLRTAYSREEFKKHPNRVIVLGDSFTYGLGVTSEDSFPARLQEHLRRALGGESVAVLNAGVSSYSPYLEKLVLEKKLLEYRPTLVVLFLDATDIGDDHQYMKESEGAAGAPLFPFVEGKLPDYRGALNELTRPYHFQLRSFMQYPFRLARGLGGGRRESAADVSGENDYYKFEIDVNGARETNRFFIYRHPLDKTRAFFDTTMRNIDQIAVLSAKMGAGFALAVTPRFHHWNAKECPDNWEKDAYGLHEPYQYEYFRYFENTKRDYPTINLLPDFKATDKYPLVFREDPHWNANGHAFVAETIARHLLKRQLIH